MIYFPKIPLKVERIQKEVAEEGMSECFYESGPQSISQMVISLCTGLEKLPQIGLRLVGSCSLLLMLRL